MICYLYVYFMISSINSLSLSCLNNRKILTNETGVIKLESLSDDENAHCDEWLIQGEIGKTITIEFLLFNTEFGFNLLFVFDGNSSSSKLIASMSGFQNGVSFTSTTNQMYLYFYSDSSAYGNGFLLNYTINSCPNNCSNNGTCSVGKCNCLESKNWISCQDKSCLKYCYKILGFNECDEKLLNCTCGNGFFGESCSIPYKINDGLNSWYTVSTGSSVFKPRSSHVAVYINNSLLVHGGFTSDGLSDQLLYYNFSWNQWAVVDVNDPKPAARYDHAGDKFAEEALVIFGGELVDGNFSNELWYFNTKWKLLSDSKMVPGLAGHTLTVVGWKIYIFGGRVFGDKISSAMYIYCYNSSTWKVIQPMKALQSRLRLVGHSANYYQEKNLIVVYGGLLYVSRNAQSIVSRDILVFDINFNTWIVWPDLSQNPSPALTFHSSVIAGSHLIVHGGWLSNAEYEPSNETYFYNLDCKSWTTYSLNNTLYTLKKRYLHTALMMNKQTILIVGGFNGAFLLNDIQAFKIPIEVLFLRTDGVWVTGFHCILYSQDKDKCLSDPSCIYCSTCLPNHQEKNCSDAILKPYQCRDQCTVLSTCEECTMYDYCNWCTLTSSCQYKESAVCFQEKTLWWGSSKGVLINTTSKCQVFDEPPGISYAYYLKPENFDYPDFVKILSDGKSIVYNVTSKATLVLKGRVYPFFRFSNADLTNHKILLRGKNINATLSLSDTSNASKLVEVVSLPFNDEYHEAAAVKNPIFLYDQNDRFQTQKLWYNLELKADLMKLGSDQYAAIEIQWNHTDNNYFALYPIPRSYLQPFETSNCSQYLTCSACVSDGYCGWCDNMLSCIPRSSWLICFNSSAEYLIRSQTQCFLCSHYFDCESCKKNSFCNWDDKISKCARKELVMSSSLECSSCINQSSIEDCLNKQTCVWCSKRKKCVLYSQVAVENKYGECLTVYYRYLAPLQNCTMLTSCSSCLKAFQCGWLYDLNDPRIGCCVNGDFSGPNDGDLQNVPVMIKSVSSWSYEICPDINECKLGIFLCVNNSICVNTLYSYECICNEGYIGDGKVECKKTCWHKCVQGICNETTYECQCNLGWTDSSCSVDCGCNGHSTCFSEVGICDQCQENTSGKHCEICEEGAYGNALTSVGCKKCECNGHGDAFQNYCSSTDGICFCLHNTVGNKCELCEPGFVGDPKDNGICYVPCKRSSIISNSYSGLLSPFTNEFPFSDYTTCVWLISTRNFTHNEYIYSDPSQFNERILISLPHTNYPTSCFESQLTIYDGIPYNPRNQKDFLMSSFKNLGRVCGTNIEKVFQSSTGMLSLVYEGKHLTFKQDASNFLIKFKILKCPDYCPSPYVCSVLGVCACPDGFFGDSCEYAKCLNNCSENRNQGICILDAYCGCKAGFTGENCSQIVSSSLWQMSTLHIFSSAGNFLEDERFGGTLVNDQSFLYMFGGRDFRTLKSPDVFRINIVTGFREKLVFTGNIQPSGRYFHCSFLYKQNMYIYGGITTNYSLSKEIWKFSLLTNNWTDLTGNFEKNVKLAGHTCTLVGDIVYIIGGHDPIDGYSEFIRLIELNSLTEQYQKFTGLTPSALYGHIAVYYPAEKKIFVHGGMAFYNEKFQVSNQVYVFDPLNEYWNLMEPRPGNLPPFLFGHCGHMINRTLLIIGGYDNLNGFNNHIYKWRPECNQWFLVKKNATYFQKSRKTNVMFALSAAFNNSIFLYGGFNYNVNGKLTVFTPPRDICQRHRTKLDCLFEMGCSWCSSKVPFCFDLNTLSCGEDISFIVNGVACSVNAARDCSTYTSCGTCLSTYPKSSSCKWCLNSHCVSKLTSCLSYTEINQCGEYSCVAASCLNCGYNCIWTYNFEYTSEFIRTYGLNYPYNCFESSLLKSSSLTSTQVQGVKDSSKQCPRYCIEYTTCNDCLNVQVLGDFGGSTGCLWSEKLSACISYSLLPLKCSFGSCGQLYSKNMLNQCPISCELQYDCLSCIKLAHCGWCADDNKGTGRCLKGDVEGPATSICGQADYDNEGLLVINSNISAMNKTWAFMVCPLENECEFLKDPCHLNEACVDKEMGFECQCKPGYSRLLSNSSLSKCVPLCGDCGNGECISPDTCICNFGWTGKNCSVPCQCNGHSNCPNETDRSICLDCRNNTMGSTCEKCKPLYVGDPTAGGNCQDCRSICNFNTDVCMTNEEYEFLKNKNIDQILLSLSYGPKSISDVKCFGCQNNSEGDYCNSCIDGYFKLSNQACQPCQCNGHSDICDKNTGEDCQCSHNTEVSPTCKKDCFKEQCTHCKQSFSGDPVNGKQCYEKISTVLDPVLRTLASEKSSFFMASPSYTNVNMRLVIDVIYGELDVYLTDSDQYFVISENATTQSQNFSIIFGSEKRGRRSNEYITLPELVVSSDKFATFCEYSGSILLVKNLRKRLVIIIKYPIHDLSTKFFYLGLSTIKKPASAFFIYYRQDLPRLHLILFFLVLIVCLLIVMCFFILAWKARQLYLQGIVVGEQHLALKTMANRPIGSYKLLLCDNDELISKRKVEKSSLCNKVTPLATQDTEDSLASVITVMVQFPSNELAECCFCLGSGLTLAHNQQLLQIKTSLTGPQGRIVNTRILSTVA